MADERHTVLFLPGFLTTDHSNLPLASVARTNGCRPARSYLPRNEGPTPRVLKHLERRFVELADERGDLTLVGVSLGGVFARMLARNHPEQVRQVVTIGSPIRFDPQGSPSRLVGRIWNSRRDRFDPAILDALELEQEFEAPLAVPSTSIFSRLDGVVKWNRSLLAAGERRENIEIRLASHVGLVVHPGTHLVLADRIRQPAGEWKPFRIPARGRALIAGAEYFDPERQRRRSA